MGYSNNDSNNDLNETLRELKEKILLEQLSSAISDIGFSTMEISLDEGLSLPAKVANILLMIAGLCNNEDDLDEFENLCADFANDKMKKIMENGGEMADMVLDKINELDNEEMKQDLFNLLEGKATMADISKRENDKKNGE